MKPTPDTQPIPIESEELNEIELHAPEEEAEELLSPEEPPGTAEITAWDEAPDSEGRRVPSTPLENEGSIVEQLVNTGNEAADGELREAADDIEEDS